MVILKKKNLKKNECKSDFNCSSSGCCFYFLGFLGAAVFYISSSTGFWNGFLGLLKALVFRNMEEKTESVLWLLCMANGVGSATKAYKKIHKSRSLLEAKIGLMKTLFGDESD